MPPRARPPPVPGYFRRIREICDRHGVLLMLDEVMCGMVVPAPCMPASRTGIVPDLLTVAKGLGGGYQPIGALLVSGEVFATIRDGSGFFQHGHTYMGHPTACAAALAVQRAIRDDKLLDNVQIMGERLDAALHTRLGDHPHVGDIRGRGLFRGIEIVANRNTREPFSPARKIHARIKQEAMTRGLMYLPDGRHHRRRARGDHVLLAPPFIIDAPQIDQVVELLVQTFDVVLP